MFNWFSNRIRVKELQSEISALTDDVELLKRTLVESYNRETEAVNTVKYLEEENHKMKTHSAKLRRYCEDLDKRCETYAMNFYKLSKNQGAK